MPMRFEIVEYRNRFHWRVRRQDRIAFRSTDFATEAQCRTAIDELKRESWPLAEVMKVVKSGK